MKDSISQQRIKLLHPKVQEKFKAFIEDAENELGIVLRIVQGLRTFEEQQAIYDQGRTKPGKVVTNAKPGSSYHQYGLAIDLGVLKDKTIDWNYDYRKINNFADKHDIIWGADWDNDGKTKADGDKDESLVDAPHFQYTLGWTWRKLLKKYLNKDFIPGTTYVNI